MGYWKAQPSSKLGRAIVRQVTTTQVNASVTTTNFGSQTFQVRIVHNLTAGIWAPLIRQRPLRLKARRHGCQPVRQSILP
jgi:hypothetical protein